MKVTTELDLYENRPISPLEAEFLAYKLSYGFLDFKARLRDMEKNIQAWHLRRIENEDCEDWGYNDYLEL